MTASDTPSLPVGIEWITNPEDCVKTVDAGMVPLAWPGDTERARRWAYVLRSYGEIPILTKGPEPDPRRWLISIGDTGHIGHAAASALGRTHHHVPDLHSAGTLEVPPKGSVLLAALARQCSFAALHPLLDRWSRNEIRVGVLTGLDQSGMIFSLAKILADRIATGPRPEMDVHLDGTTASTRTTTGQNPRLAEALTATWRTIAVDGHGTGSHATLGSYTLCGLLGDHEHMDDGSDLADGCAPGRCRAGRGVLEQVLMRDLRCRFIALFVCNAITLGIEEQFPSDLSLALAALEGHPAATLGLLRQDADTDNTEPTTALRLLASGLLFGTVASWLSDDAAARGRPTAYVLLGDPDHAYPATGPAVRPVPWPDDQQPRLPAVIDRTGNPVKSVLSRHGPLPPANFDAPLSTWDAADEIRLAVTALSNWVADTDEAAHLEDALWALSITSKRKHVVSECLEQMREHRQAARQIALQRLQAAQACHRRSRGVPEPVPHAELEHHAHTWATELSRTFQIRAGVFRLWEALEANYHPHQTVIADSCPRCAAPHTRTELTSPLAGTADRISITCPRCGPHAHYPVSRRLHVTVPAWLRPDNPVRITIALPGTTPSRTTGGGLVVVQLQARSGLSALDSASCSAGPGEHHSLTMSVPSDLEPELHRLWVLWIYRFHISLLQARVPTLPTAESPPARC